jgi:hypothetical protein
MTQIHPERCVGHLQTLYTVVAGLALTGVITNLIAKEQKVPIRSFLLLPHFITYLFTLVPFYQGALSHLNATHIEDIETDVRPGALMAVGIFKF